MPDFRYTAHDKDGRTVSAVAAASDRIALARNLRDEGLIVYRAVELTKLSREHLKERLNIFFSSVGLKEKIVFANNLGAMIDAGLSLTRALDILKRETRNPKLQNILSSIEMRIGQGGTLTDALSDFPEVFPAFFIAMVNSGEESGRLPETLKTVSEQLAKTYELRKKIRGAMIYPTIIIGVIIVIGILMMVYLVPTLAETFKELDAELPVPTKIVIGISDFLQNNILTFLLLTSGIGLVFWRGMRTKKGKRWLAYVILRLPVIGGLAKQANSAVTTRTLSSLISSGIGIVHALDITRQVVQNPYYVDVLEIAQKEVQKGLTLSSIFQKEEKLYPIFVGEMIDVGEETGKLSEMLAKTADFYEEEVDAATKNLSTIIEPALMIFVGLAVGFFAVAMIQPIYSLGDFI